MWNVLGCDPALPVGVGNESLIDTLFGHVGVFPRDSLIAVLERPVTLCEVSLGLYEKELSHLHSMLECHSSVEPHYETLHRVDP